MHKLTNLVLQPAEARGRDFEFAALMESNRVAEEFPATWPVDRALRLIDHELELLGQESGDPLLDSLFRFLAFDIDIGVIVKTTEAMPLLLQFSVQLREKDVGEDRA